MMARFASKLQTDSITDGQGLRAVVWFQGCKHQCLGCHNAHTHDMKGGFECDIETFKENIKNVSYHDGITLSGGDPLFQPQAALEIAKYVKSLGMNVWCYTGFTYEQIIKMSHINSVYRKLLENIDVLVDGRFEEKLKTLDMMYRGSKNQRIINVKKSLKRNKVVLIKKYNKSKSNINLYQKNEYVFI